MVTATSFWTDAYTILVRWLRAKRFNENIVVFGSVGPLRDPGVCSGFYFQYSLTAPRGIFFVTDTGVVIDYLNIFPKEEKNGES